LSTQVVAKPRQGWECAALAYGHAADQFTPLGVGHADYRHVADARMIGKKVFDLLGAYLFTLADDDVLLASGDGQNAIRRQATEVACAYPAIDRRTLAVGYPKVAK